MKPGSGNTVVINHGSGLQTRYYHLSRFAKGLKPGKQVQQKEVIGYVGNHWLSTGPHLHFSVTRLGFHRSHKLTISREAAGGQPPAFLEAVRPRLAACVFCRPPSQELSILGHGSCSAWPHKGGIVGAAVGIAASRVGLGAGATAWLVYGVVGFLVGLVCGKPPWAAGNHLDIHRQGRDWASCVYGPLLGRSQGVRGMQAPAQLLAHWRHARASNRHGAGLAGPSSESCTVCSSR